MKGITSNTKRGKSINDWWIYQKRKALKRSWGKIKIRIII